MIKAELSYPFEPNRVGIPFQQVIDSLNKGLKVGYFTSGSGRVLSYASVKPTALEISDSLNQEFFMGVDITDGAVLFDINTNLPELKLPWTNNGRHPDMFASKFVLFVMEHFAKFRGTQIHTWRASWNICSINYSEFFELIERGYQPADAARNTWEGKLASKHGFNIIRPEDIIINPDLSNYVSASFFKSES